jgi:hypothetical protein
MLCRGGGVHAVEMATDKCSPECNPTGNPEQEKRNGRRAPGGDQARGDAPAAMVA